MRNRDKWLETKFSLIDGDLRASHNTAATSRNITDMVAQMYGQYIPQFTHGDLLDLGCGMCPLYGLYRDYATSILCLDWPSSLHQSPYVDVYADLNAKIPIHGEQFDTIILSDVLEHLPDPQLLLTECHRLLRTEGALLLNVPYYYWIHEAPFDYHRYTEFALRRMLEQAGFTVSTLQIVGGAVETWCDLTTKLSVYLPMARRVVPQLLWMLSNFIHHNQQIKNKLHTIDRLFPTGYFIVAKRAEVAG